MIQACPLSFTPQVASQESDLKTTASSVFTSVKNALWGRVDFRDKLLGTAAFCYIIQSVYCLVVLGSVLGAGFALATAVLLVNVRRKLREAASFEKQLRQLEQQNDTFQLNNFELRQITTRLEKYAEDQKRIIQDLKQNVDAFKIENGKLRDERIKFGKENQKFSEHNALYRQLLGTFGEGVTNLTGLKNQIEKVLREGRQLNKQSLEKLLAAVGFLGEQKQILVEVAEELKGQQTQALEQYQELIQQTKKINHHGLEALRIAKEDLEKTRIEAAAATQELSSLKGQIADLKAQISELKKTAQVVREAGDYANAAARNVYLMTFGNTVNEGLNRVFGTYDSSEGSYRFDWEKSLTVSGILAFALYSYYIKA